MSKKKKQLTKAERHKQDIEKLIRLRQIDHKTIEECAGLMNVSPRTIKYWLASDEYKATQEEMRDDWREAAITHAHFAAEKAIATMIKLLDYPNSGHVQFEAAKQLGDWVGVQRVIQGQGNDDRGEVDRLMKILEERPTTINNNTVFLSAPEPGGFLPKPLQRVVDVTPYLAAKEEDTDEGTEASEAEI